MSIDLSETAVSDVEARQHALKATLQFFPPTAAKVGVSLWSLGNLPEGGPGLFVTEPTRIFDVSGRLLFHEFQSVLNDGSQVQVRAAANRLLGAPVSAISIGAPEDYVALLAAAAKVAKSKKLTPATGAKRLVCYSYPKLGLLCRRSNGSRVVLDLFDQQIVSEPPEGHTAPTAEAPVVWSLFDRVHPGSAGERNDEWANNLSVLSKSVPTAAAGFEASATAAKAAAEEAKLSLDLVGQQTPVFCAVATAKMILAFHGIAKSQTEIAKKMKVKGMGATNPDQVKAYASYLNGATKARLDETASFAEARKEIDAGRPLKSGIPGHARAVGGWRRQTKGSAVSTWLYVYDPWPVKQGRVYWENWDTVAHSNFIYVRA